MFHSSNYAGLQPRWKRITPQPRDSRARSSSEQQDYRFIIRQSLRCMKILQNQYELTNHLGNVQATVLDRATPILDNDTFVTGYKSDISLAHDYYPFSMLMPGRYVSDTGRKCVTINTSILVPVIVKVYLWQTEGVAYKNGGISTPPVHQLPVALVAADEKPYVYHYNDESTHPNGEVITGQTVEGNAEYTISLSEEPSGGVTTYFQVHADTNQTDQEIGFDLTLPGDCYVDMRVRQYYTGTGEEYYDAVTWTQVDMSGAQQLLVPIDKTSVAAGGKTILELRFNTTSAADFPGDIGGVIRNFYYKITHYEPKTHIAIVCDEKDNYRFGYATGEKDNEIAGIGNHVDLGERGADTRTGRLGWRVDPLAHKFPWQSPYVYAGNNPIYYLDEKGEKKTTYFTIVDERSGTTTKIKTVTPGLLARSYKRMDSEIRTYDWFDYSQNVNVTIRKDGSRSVSISDPIQGKYRTSTFFKNAWAALEDAGEHRVKDNRSFGGWIGTSSSGGGEDNGFNPNAGKGSKYVDFGTLLNAFKMVNMSNRNAGPDGILDAIGYLNTATDFATDDSRPLTPVTINGRPDQETSKLKYCKNCGGYVTPDSSLTEEKPNDGEKVDTTDYTGHK